MTELRAAGVVRSGPFTGMRYVDEPSWGRLGPLLVGSYEAELHQHIEAIVGGQPPRIIDVGCAEGYYAVGLARRCPDSEVFAFDVDPEARRRCGLLADLNGVADQVHIAGACTQGDLQRLAGHGSFILVDCEGCEVELLDPVEVPALRHCHVLVEMHDFIHPGASAAIVERFRSSHVTTVVTAEPRRTWPSLGAVSPEVQERVLFEGRPAEPPMQWAVMRVR